MSDRSSILTAEEQLVILSAMIRAEIEDIAPKDRIAAAKLRSQMLGELVNKTQLTGADGGPVKLEQLTLAQIQDLLKGQ